MELEVTPAQARELFREYGLGSDLFVPAAICREIEALGLGEHPEAPLTAQYLRRLFFGLYEGNQNMGKRSMDDFNANNRLKSQLLRAEERVRELEAALLKQSAAPAADCHADASSPTATTNPPGRGR